MTDSCDILFLRLCIARKGYRDLDHWRHDCSRIVWRGHKRVCRGASVQGDQAARHNGSTSVFQKQGGRAETRSEHTAFSFSALREGDCRTEQQRLLLCSGSAWEVVSTLLCSEVLAPSMGDAGSLIYVHSILQTLGKEQHRGMWTAEELALTFSLGAARNPAPYNAKNSKAAQV